ncbi:MAG: hypothetical protein PHR35_14950 [Kiritimatiellae bacterium]|nr:hypothetical protein [Kiritimatiellia bacterium]
MKADWLHLAVLLAVLGGCVWLHGFPAQPDIDSHAYLALAEGRRAEVVQPYAGRLLHPLTVRGVLSARLVSSLDAAFIVVAFVAAIVFIGTVSRLLRCSVTRFDQSLLLGAPILSLYAVNIHLPDLFFAACLSLLLMALSRGWMWLALAGIFMLHLTRESALLVSAMILMLALVKRNWRLAVGCFAAASAGLLVAGWAAGASKTNIHGLNGATYLFAKFLANGAANLLGVIVWSDSYARQFPDRYSLAPLWRMTLPAGLTLGGIREIGIYRLAPEMIVTTVRIMLTTFGLLPVLALRLIRERGLPSLRSTPLPIMLAALIGALFYVLAPFSGRSVDRLAGYGWPLFWLAVPLLGADIMKRHGYTSRWFYGLHFLCCWYPVVLRRFGLNWNPWAIISAILCGYALGWLITDSRHACAFNNHGQLQ